MPINPNMILPSGTKIVTLEAIQRKGIEAMHKGAVGVIQVSPLDNTHHYVVRFPDDTELPLKRRQFAVQKQFRREGMEQVVLADRDLYDYVIYRCITGSRAYGLDHEDSDTDLRGIYLPPASLHWSLYSVPEQLEQGEEAYWELQKFLKLALKANPNILEALYTPKVLFATPLAEELLAMRQVFVTRLLYQTYNGYVLSQFKKMNKHLENHGTIRWKHAMHLIRLLLSGIEALKTGEIPVDVGEHREQLLAIRKEEITWEQVNQWRLALHKELDKAYSVSHLPERPDYEAVNAFLIKARRAMVD
jgi:predicted nucleotidyltransferase